MKPGGGVREYSGIGAMGQAPIAQWSTNRGVRGARNYLRWLVYPRFHAERGSPTDYRIKYEGPPAHWGDDGRLRWFLHS
jgi:hypothetical protein